MFCFKTEIFMKKFSGLFSAIGMALAVFAVVSAQPARALEKPQVTLLVSLDPDFYPTGLPALFHDYSKYPEKIEKTFREAFQNSGYDVRVIQNATRFDLYETLTNSPQTIGVFWVSHEAPVSWSKTPGIQINPLLVDQIRADVKPLFEHINPNVRWVSLVACDSDDVIQWLGGQNAPSPSPSPSEDPTELQGFNQEVDANEGLKQAIQQSLPVLHEASTPQAIARDESSCESSRGMLVHVSRQMSAIGASAEVLFPAVTIEQNGEILGALPQIRLQPGQTLSREEQVFLSPPSSGSWSAKDLQLIIQSGLDPASLPKGFTMGSFNVSGDWSQASWKTFSKPNGTPFGVTQQVILFSGSLPQAADAVTYHPYACE
jgi:hypothetical protein